MWMVTSTPPLILCLHPSQTLSLGAVSNQQYTLIHLHHDCYPSRWCQLLCQQGFLLCPPDLHQLPSAGECTDGEVMKQT